ncbi:MAG: ASKHA domain-containing protein [Anaerolineaceae bacterium]|jgi:uncharacterized 2Fe-2S/4Fe-4S cluster protein (DUF4445 family)
MINEDTSKKLKIDFEPIGRRVKVSPGTTILEAARLAGIDLVSVCGGAGTCGRCQVRIRSGLASEITDTERKKLSEAEVKEGFRLACQTSLSEDTCIQVPPQSLTTPQRTQLEGQGDELPVTIDWKLAGLSMRLPSLDDLTADLTRFREGVSGAGFSKVEIESSALVSLPEQLRKNQWDGQVVLRGMSGKKYRAVSFLPSATIPVGIAVDIGTTKIAMYLVDLQNGRTLAKSGAMNPQISYGEDVISRISYCNTHADGRKVLQSVLVETLNAMIEENCQTAGITRDQLVEGVMVGNTVMHHLFGGFPVQQLGEAPYVAAVSEAVELHAASIGLMMAPGAHIYLPPNIAGYVGGDHVAMLLATGTWNSKKNVIALDIGTNTEVCLASEGKLYCCSCASGPAFEGAHIQAGMRAARGAIERVEILNGNVFVQSIGGLAPVGICGSGILDAVAEMTLAKIVDTRGSLRSGSPGVRARNDHQEFVLVTASESGTQDDIVITRSDVNQIQLAKAAIRAGVDVLLTEAKLDAQALDEFIVAGAFGTYLDLEHAVRIGMFPNLPLERFKQVGNAAGSGAKQLLVSKERRRAADLIAEKMRYIELTTYPGFDRIYVQNMYL